MAARGTYPPADAGDQEGTSLLLGQFVRSLHPVQVAKFFQSFDHEGRLRMLHSVVIITDHFQTRQRVSL